MIDDTTSIQPEENKDVHNCKTSTYQLATVSVPVTVKPLVSTGDANTYCYGEPIITPLSCKLKYVTKPHGCCSYVISQNVCIEIPIEFGAIAHVGDPAVVCGKVCGVGEDGAGTETYCCKECNKKCDKGD